MAKLLLTCLFDSRASEFGLVIPVVVTEPNLHTFIFCSAQNLEHILIFSPTLSQKLTKLVRFNNGLSMPCIIKVMVHYL